jgi:hypothetical protein
VVAQPVTCWEGKRLPNSAATPGCNNCSKSPLTMLAACAQVIVQAAPRAAEAICKPQRRACRWKYGRLIDSNALLAISNYFIWPSVRKPKKSKLGLSIVNRPN